jgi:hypothetical protein
MLVILRPRRPPSLTPGSAHMCTHSRLGPNVSNEITAEHEMKHFQEERDGEGRGRGSVFGNVAPGLRVGVGAFSGREGWRRAWAWERLWECCAWLKDGRGGINIFCEQNRNSL